MRVSERSHSLLQSSSSRKLVPSRHTAGLTAGSQAIICHCQSRGDSDKGWLARAYRSQVQSVVPCNDK